MLLFVFYYIIASTLFAFGKYLEYIDISATLFKTRCLVSVIIYVNWFPNRKFTEASLKLYTLSALSKLFLM